MDCSTEANTKHSTPNALCPTNSAKKQMSTLTSRAIYTWNVKSLISVAVK